MSASTAITPFLFGGEHLVRVLTINDAPWWVLREICDVLGLSKPESVARKLDESEKGTHLMSTLGGAHAHQMSMKGVHLMDTAGARREMIVVNEPGLYRLIMRSDKPVARRFQHWLFHEVLPQIRKTGSYGAKNVLTDAQKQRKADMLYKAYGRAGLIAACEEFGWGPPDATVREEAARNPVYVSNTTRTHRRPPEVDRAELLYQSILRTVCTGPCTLEQILRDTGDIATRFEVTDVLDRMIRQGAIISVGDRYRVA